MHPPAKRRPTLVGDLATTDHDSQQIAATETQPISPRAHNARPTTSHHVHGRARPQSHFLQPSHVLGTPDQAGDPGRLPGRELVQGNQFVGVCCIDQGWEAHEKIDRTRFLLNMRLNLSRSTDIVSAFSVLCKDAFFESRVAPPHTRACVARKRDFYSPRERDSFCGVRSCCSGDVSAGPFRELTEHESAIHVETPNLGKTQSCSTNHTARIASITRNSIRSPPISGRGRRRLHTRLYSSFTVVQSQRTVKRQSRGSSALPPEHGRRARIERPMTLH